MYRADRQAASRKIEVRLTRALTKINKRVRERSIAHGNMVVARNRRHSKVGTRLYPRFHFLNPYPQSGCGWFLRGTKRARSPCYHRASRESWRDPGVMHQTTPKQVSAPEPDRWRPRATVGCIWSRRHGGGNIHAVIEDLTRLYRWARPDGGLPDGEAFKRWWHKHSDGPSGDGNRVGELEDSCLCPLPCTGSIVYQVLRAGGRVVEVSIQPCPRGGSATLLMSLRGSPTSPAKCIWNLAGNGPGESGPPGIPADRAEVLPPRLRYTIHLYRSEIG